MPAAEQAPAVTGAVPYKPKMTKAEVLDEIEKVSGTPATLSDLRPTLPTARAGRPAPVSTGARGAGGTGRRKIASRATKAAPASLAALTNDERLLLIDQAMLMLQEVYAHLPLKRALHAIDQRATEAARSSRIVIGVGNSVPGSRGIGLRGDRASAVVAARGLIRLTPHSD